MPTLSQHFRQTSVLALPLILGNLSTGLTGLIDNIIAGHHGTQTLASVTVGTSLLWLPILVPLGTLVALTASVSQLLGAGREIDIGPLFRQALWLALSLGLLLFAILSLSPWLLPRLGIPSTIVSGAAHFLLTVRWGVPALTLFLCMRSLCEGLHWTIPSMLFSFGGLIVLAPLGYSLTFGRLGFAEYGASGLGAATAMTMWLQVSVFACYLGKSQRFTQLRLYERFDKPNWTILLELLRIGLPIGITILMEGGLFIVATLLVGQIGAGAAAAHQIALNVSQVCFMVPMGIAEATTVRVGHAVGSQDSASVRQAAWTGYAMIVLTQMFLGLLVMLGHQQIAHWYTTDFTVIRLATPLLIISAAFQIPDGVQVVSAGALRGMHDTRVPMLLAMFSYWGVGMSIGIILGFSLHRGLIGIWLGLLAGITTAAILMTWRFLQISQRVTQSKVTANNS